MPPLSKSTGNKLILFTITFVCVSLFVCVQDLNMLNIFSTNWLPGIFNLKVISVSQCPYYFYSQL